MDFVRQGILEEPISREVCEAVKSNQKCKSPGEDRIINEVWKNHDLLVEGSNQPLEGAIPTERVDGIVVPIHGL